MICTRSFVRVKVAFLKGTNQGRAHCLALCLVEPRVPSPSLPSFRQMRYSRMSLSSLLPLHPEAAVRHPDLGGSRRPHPLRQPSPLRWLSRTRTHLFCRHCTCTDRATHFPHTTHTTPRPWYESTHGPATNGTRSHNPPRPWHISTSRAATNTCCTLGSPCTCHATEDPRIAWYVMLCTSCTPGVLSRWQRVPCPAPCCRQHWSPNLQGHRLLPPHQLDLPHHRLRW
jgi:hypothetical protein